MVKTETIVRYTGIWNKLKANNIDLSKLDTMTQSEFNKTSGMKGAGQFRLAKSLARNTERQKDINAYVKRKKIPSSIIPKIKVKEYIPKVKKAAKKKPKKAPKKKPTPPAPPTTDKEYERLRVWLFDYFPEPSDVGKDVEKAFKKEVKNWDSLDSDTKQGLITDWTNFIGGGD